MPDVDVYHSNNDLRDDRIINNKYSPLSLADTMEPNSPFFDLGIDSCQAGETSVKTAF